MSIARFKPQAEPPTPPSGFMYLFCDIADGLLYYKLDDGTVLPVKPTGSGTGDLSSDGTVPLIANWDVGAFNIIALGFESDVATGTAPLVVASTTMVTNLNAELHGGKTLATIESDYAAAIAAAVTGLWDDKGAYDADTNSPDLDTSPSGIKRSDAYTVSVAGTFFTEAVEVGDMLVAKQDDPTTLAHWNIFQANLNAASIKALYESNADTNEFSDAEQTKLSNAMTVNTAGEIAAMTEKATPISGDWVVIEDSADSNNKKKAQVGNLPGGGGGSGPLNNFAATTDPGVGDDDADGYEVGSWWQNSSAGSIWLARSVATAAAIWDRLLTFATTSLSGASFFLDEDDMASDSATKVPSQQSVKAYVDSTVAGNVRSEWIPITGMFQGGSNAPGAEATIGSVNTGGQFRARAFDASASESMYFSWRAPKNFISSSGVSFLAIWSPTNTNTGTLRWELRIRPLADGEAIDQTHLASGNFSDDAGSGTANVLQISTEGPRADASVIEAGDLVSCRILRRPDADDYNADANLIGVTLFYTIGQPNEV